MGNIFAAREIVEMGIQIETNGMDFYNVLAGRAGNDKPKEIFKYLANEEAKHVAVFQKILAPMARYEPKEAYPGEYFAYMNALAGDYVFTQKDKGAEIAGKIKSDEEAVDIGIGFEKDSIVFYEGMKKAAPEDGQKTIDELIAQERTHLLKLLDLKKSL
ncbi:MAG: ferritin family protein [Candidatus Omnitrophica bacterium]|nr:ferritin family protein [Candidatus Omnitrophota bacterium]